ncbi:MAG TPA: peptidoglycan DD-metalloendopeptidase family protein [Gaiellaceae bacterium]|jgi:murein DD-endopeptidase MepM/ murein hydrolase activator NlpD|nr:peptidoglycan DD-metalloendopeptidase family protein [Gaiellaceae bacterium]
MARRLGVLLILGFALVAGPAFGGDNLGQQKASLDAQLASVQAKIAATRTHESALNAEIGSLNTAIGKLEAKVGGVSARLSALESDLALRERRLKVLNRLFSVQTMRFHDLRHEYSLALTRLDDRLVSIYKQPDPGTIDLVLQAKSFQDVLDEIDYVGLVANEDKTIAFQVAQAKAQVIAARKQTVQVRQAVRNEANKINARVQAAAILRGQLLSSKGKLANARAAKGRALVITKAQEQSEIKESQAIAASSAAIEAKIRASEGGSSDTPAATPSAAGFIWPVQGPITSPFGPRWGTIHPGIDIGVPEGTPIHAAAAGTVIYCGWEEGYGNLVVIDHHNGLATAYGHQSRIVVGCNQDVSLGEVIGYSGCTGYCFGPHVHFEVRVNGTPVDPIGYLP